MADPDQERSDWTPPETASLLRGVVRRGRRWSVIIADYPGVFLTADGGNRLPSTLRGKWDNIERQQEGLADPLAICELLQGVHVEALGGLVVGPVIGGHARLANWNEAETAALRNGVNVHGKNWDAISNDNNLLFNEDRRPFDLRAAWLQISDFDAATAALRYLGLMLNAQAAAAQGNVQQAQLNGQAAAAVQQVQGQVQNVQQGEVGQAAAAVQHVQGPQVQGGWSHAQTVALLEGISLLGKKWASIKRNPEFVDALNGKNTNQMKAKWSRIHNAQQPLIAAGQLCRMLQGFPVDIIPIVPVPVEGVGSDAAREAALLLQLMRNAANANVQQEAANANVQQEAANADVQQEAAIAEGAEQQQQEVAIGKAPAIGHLNNADDGFYD